MAYSDDRIIPALRRLAADGHALTIEEIAEASNVPYGTVKRRLAVLQRIGVIATEGSGRRWGRVYRMIDDDRPTDD
ncbi:MAG: winged helix-turn-helix transcriptional regulator [Anaerolineae bacterium]|nr:winged helix-turn-helix transcriptional regulator [Anaerolineae bacterium]NUQ03825.1 winged helix-turn-helix transcriptional regulator [Anaerolineae bacterium]